MNHFNFDGGENENDEDGEITISATDKQIELLIILGVKRDVAAALSKDEAWQMIASIRSKPTQKQISVMRNNGLSSREIAKMSSEDAKRWIADLAAKQGWGKKNTVRSK